MYIPLGHGYLPIHIIFETLEADMASERNDKSDTTSLALGPVVL